jgi:acyl-CoA thioesterase-1
MGYRIAQTCAVLTFLLWLPACGEDGSGVSVPPPTAKSAPSSPRPELKIPADAPVVVSLGDSLAAGMHLPADQAFPAVLQRRLAAAGLPFRLVNAGVSGNTTAAGRARVAWILKQGPDVVVVELGANDGFRGLPLQLTEANVRGILEKVREHGATPLLLGMRLPPNYGADYVGAFDALFRRIATETGVAYVPFFMDGVAGIPEMNLADGIHPTEAGHEKLAANLEASLAGLLRR